MYHDKVVYIERSSSRQRTRDTRKTFAVSGGVESEVNKDKSDTDLNLGYRACKFSAVTTGSRCFLLFVFRVIVSVY